MSAMIFFFGAFLFLDLWPQCTKVGMHGTSSNLMDVETVAVVCTLSDLLSKCYTPRPGAILVLHTGPRATLVRHAGLGLLTLFPVPYMSFS